MSLAGRWMREGRESLMGDLNMLGLLPNDMDLDEVSRRTELCAEESEIEELAQ